MESHDKALFLEAFGRLKDACMPFKDVGQDDINRVVKVFWDALEPLPLEQVLLGFQRAVESWPYSNTMPNVAYLLECCGAGVKDPESEAKQLRRQCMEVFDQLMQPADGKPYNRAVYEKDEDVEQVFREMGGSYSTSWGFGRWERKHDRYKRLDFADRLMALKCPNHMLNQGLDHDESMGFLRDSGLGPVMPDFGGDEDLPMD